MVSTCGTTSRTRPSIAAAPPCAAEVRCAGFAGPGITPGKHPSSRQRKGLTDGDWIGFCAKNVERDLIGVTALGLVHRGVGASDQGVAVERLGRPGDSDAGVHVDGRRADIDAVVEKRCQSFSDRHSGFSARHLRADDEELVAAYPTDRVSLSYREPETIRCCCQQPVAGGVPEPVVDRLEPVEIEVDNRVTDLTGMQPRG